MKRLGSIAIAVVMGAIVSGLGSGSAIAIPSICDSIAGNLVANCGFETGTFSSWTQSGNTGSTDTDGDIHSGSFGAEFGPIGSLGFIAVTTILLMSPAAYHRIAERGEDTKRFHKVASGLLVAAMIALPPGICGDVYVVIYKVTNSVATSIVCATLALACFYGTWFGYTGYKRTQIDRGSD